MKKVILSSALGTFDLGMAEFGIIGVPMELAHNIGISVPAAGHTILYYVLEMVVGAPTIALFSSRYPLKHILLSLVALCVIGNAMFTLSSPYVMFAIGRLVSGFPHDALFGVNAIVLSKIIKPGKVTTAMARMVSGMTIISLLGIPLGAYLGQEFSWRYTFLLIAVPNIAVTASVYLWMPGIRDEAKGKLREQFHFLCNPAPWLIFAATIFGSTGVFAWFSYVKPYIMFVPGFSETAVTFIMVLAGLEMVLGSMLSSRISGRYLSPRIAAVADFITVPALLTLSFYGGMKTTSLILTFICCAGLFALSTPLRVLLLQNVKGGELLGAAGRQIAFNLGSAIDACYGDMMLTLGLARNYVALPAALLPFVAMSSLPLHGRYKRRQATDSPVLAKPLG